MEVHLASNETITEGTLTRQPTQEGTVVFDDVVFGVHPGSRVKVQFTSDPPTSIIALTVDIDDCDSDQVEYKKE